MADFVGAVDQGTTSTRFMVFDHDGAEVGRHQLEHEQVMPQAGWVEHNPLEIWERTQTVDRFGAVAPQPAADRPVRARASPTSARPPSCGTSAPAGPCTTRSSGRTPAPTASPGPSTTTGGATSSASAQAFRPRPTSPPARCSGSSTTSTAAAGRRRERRRDLRHHRHLAAVEPHRRHRRRSARHRRDQRQPHDADGPARPSTGTTSCSASSTSRARCSPRSGPARTPSSTA